MTKQRAYEILVSKRNEISNDCFERCKSMEWLAQFSEAVDIAAKALGEQINEKEFNE